MPKKTKNKWIYIGGGLAILILIAVSGFFLWKKGKSSDKSDAVEAEDDFKDSPKDIKEWRNRDWTDKESGYSAYKVPTLPKNVSAKRAKEEVIEYIYHQGGQNWDRKKVERTLEKNAQRINLADKKEEDDDPLFNSKFVETLAEKYQKDIFFNRPNQDKFESSINETKSSFFFLLYSFSLKYKNDKEIDWQASLKEITEPKKRKNKSKSQKEADLQTLTDRLEAINAFLVMAHVPKFISLTTLAELNQWTNILARKIQAAARLVNLRWNLAQEIGKKVPNPKNDVILIKDPKFKNEKFDLIPSLHINKSREEK